jgi:bisphosphoglycerate-dependent phosphoglycerate mutase
MKANKLSRHAEELLFKFIHVYEIQPFPLALKLKQQQQQQKKSSKIHSENNKSLKLLSRKTLAFFRRSRAKLN